MTKFIKFRLILWLILLAVIIFLLWQWIIPSGQISYNYNFYSDSGFIGKLSPKERVLPPKSGQQAVIGNPVYFAVRTPRQFEQAKLSITYKNEVENLPVMEAGVLVDKAIWRYNLQPMQNRTIDQVLPAWFAIKQDDILFLQREKKYDSWEDFQKDPASFSQIAVYNYDLPRRYYISNYQASSVYNSLNYSLRGTYQFYVYLDNEALNLNFLFKDLNLNQDSDAVQILIYDQYNSLIGERTIADDSIADSTGQESKIRSIHITRNDLSTGVYKIEFKANDDIITTQLATPQSKLAFINKLWLSNPEQTNITVYSDSQAISLQTINPASLQTISINDKFLEIPNTYEQFTLINKEPINKIHIAKGDIIISGKGVFSFDQASLLNPDYQIIDNYFELTDKINYIVANYKTPQTNGEWQTAVLDFDISNAYREDDKYSFLISIPGLRLEDDYDDQIIIKNIKLELLGKSLWKKIDEWKK